MLPRIGVLFGPSVSLGTDIAAVEKRMSMDAGHDGNCDDGAVSLLW